MGEQFQIPEQCRGLKPEPQSPPSPLAEEFAAAQKANPSAVKEGVLVTGNAAIYMPDSSGQGIRWMQVFNKSDPGFSIIDWSKLQEDQHKSLDQPRSAVEFPLIEQTTSHNVHARFDVATQKLVEQTLLDRDNNGAHFKFDSDGKVSYCASVNSKEDTVLWEL